MMKNGENLKNYMKQITIDDFIKQLSDGMKCKEECELVIYNEPFRDACIRWTLNCLANPQCGGSKTAINAIIEKREQTRSNEETHHKNP